MNPHHAYTQRLCRQYPGLFVVLLDQSASMSQEVETTTMPLMRGIPQTGKNGKYTKSDIATAVINNIIYTIMNRAGIDEFSNQPKHYVYLCVLGYHESVVPLITRDENRSLEPITIAELSKRGPIGMIPVEESVQGSIGIVSRRYNKPYWINVKDVGRSTNMAAAFEFAKAVVERWLSSPAELISPKMGKQASREESFPPVIINVTDAQVNDGKNPLGVVKAIQSSGTNDGKCLVFNCHFTTERVQPVLFPGNRSEVSHLDSNHLAELMFDMSSPIPATMISGARKLLLRPVSPTARGYVYNANPQALIEFLQWGTLGIQQGTQPSPRW